MNTSNENTNQVKISGEINLFISHLESLHTVIPITMIILQSINKDLQKKLDEFQNNNCEQGEDENGKYIIVPPEHHSSWKKYGIIYCLIECHVR